MNTIELAQRIQLAFPVEPMPGQYWLDGVDLSGDIQQELAARIIYRPWIEITINDWTMTGARASNTRAFLDANAFRYCLPSILTGGLANFDYIDWALECLLPAGRHRNTTGEWWQTFFAGFTDGQRNVVERYLTSVRSLPVDTVAQRYIEKAMTIWDA